MSYMDKITVKRRGNLYTVLKNGKEVIKPTSYERALEKQDALENTAKTKKRHCMTCRCEFQSAGPHHRLCALCRTKSHYDGSA